MCAPTGEWRIQYEVEKEAVKSNLAKSVDNRVVAPKVCRTFHLQGSLRARKCNILRDPTSVTLRRLRSAFACTILPATGRGGNLDARGVGHSDDRSGHGLDNR